jgi:DNA-binding transcriptional ArsR family regulator
MLNCVALDKVFKSLADPWRRHMIECLCDGEASVSYLAEHLPLSLSAILKHLQVLEENGLIHTEKVGRQRICRIEPQALQLLDQWVSPRRKVWDHRLQRLLAAVNYRLYQLDYPGAGSG